MASASRPLRRDCEAPGAQHELEDVSSAGLAAAADALGEAFEGYPWTDWVLPQENRRERVRALQHASLALIARPYGVARVARCPGSGRVAGAVAALRPDTVVPPEAWLELAAEERAQQGLGYEAGRAADALLTDLRPIEPVLVIAALGVTADHRRRQIGTRLLTDALRLADDLGVGTYLETSTLANVALYTAAGFDITGNVKLPDGGPPVWAMRRGAVSGSATAREWRKAARSGSVDNAK